MKRNSTYIIIILFVIFSISSLAQIKIKNYIENDYEIDIILEIPQIENNDKSILQNIFVQNIFIGIPYGIKHSLNFKIMQPENICYLSSLINSFSKNLIQKESPIIKVKGYLWVENIYCINLEINQFNNDVTTWTKNKTKEIEINIVFNQKISSKKYLSQGKLSQIASKIVTNYKYALKYSKERPIIDLFDTTGTWLDYSKIYIKIKTATDEIYRISYQDLERYIPQLSQIDPLTVNLYLKGKKYPIYIYGEEDHEFNPGDYIEFIGHRNVGYNYKKVNSYNEPYNEYLDRYSDTTVFWLVWNDIDRLRAELIENITLNNVDTLEYYFERNHVEYNNWFDYSADLLVRKELPFWIENKTWNWQSIGPGVTTYNFPIYDLYPVSSSNILVKIQSYASNKLKQSHLLGLQVNEYPTIYDSNYVDRYSQKVLRANLVSSLLFNGINKLKLHSYPTNQEINLIFIDWYEIEYPKYLKLINDSLKFDLGFLTSDRILALKIKKELNNNFVIWRNNKKYLSGYIDDNYLIITDTMSNCDNIYIKAENKIRTPIINEPKTFKNLRNAGTQADYIIITHKTFYDYAAEYKKFVESAYTINAIVIDVEDIFDEFNYGYFNPEPIKKFLISANTLWKSPTPRYVFIIGDGTYDYYHNKEKNMGSPACNNFVPSFGVPVSDNWYVTWDTTGAYFPMMNIGRIPVKTVDEFFRYFERHKQYLEHIPDDWNKRYMFFSGGPGNDQYELNKYKSINDQIIDLIDHSEVGGKSIHFYKTSNPVTNFGPYSSEEIENAIDSSALIISYIGHSGTQTWDNTVIDPKQLKNLRGRCPLITDFGCSTGKFAEPDVTSFAEMFINDPNGQAIVYIGNSSLGFFTTSSLYPALFYAKIFLDSVYTISEAHRLAKMELLATYGTSEVFSIFALTNTFFGDPLVSLPVPQKADICVHNCDIKFDRKNLNDREDTVRADIYFYNFGRAISDSISIIIKDEYSTSLKTIEEMKIALPVFISKVTVAIPINGKAGQHLLKVQFDVNNVLEELHEDNNYACADFYVRNSNLRMIPNYDYEGAVKDSLVLINQNNLSDEDKLLFEYSNDRNFDTLKIIEKEIKDLFTYINFNQLEDKGRIFIRAKTNSDSCYSLQASLTLNNDNIFLINDSITFSQIQKNNLVINNNGISPDTALTKFSVISAGFNDGKTAVISKDGQTYVPGGNTIGHHVCLFKDLTYQFVGYRRFNVYGGGEVETQNYYKFLDSLTSDYLVLIAVNDEGRVVDSLKRKLYEFGSIYIDSLRFRSSWAIIGKRGAPRGSVPEGVSHPFQGKVTLDTLIKNTWAKGNFSTGKIGPAGEWENVNLYCNNYYEFPAELKIIGIKNNGENDTLKELIVTSPEINIRDIDPLIYPYIKLTGEINGNRIVSLGVKYKQSPELLVMGKCSDNFVNSGNKLNILVKIINAGETPAKNFNVVAFISDLENNRDTILNKRINYLQGGEGITFETSYFTHLSGFKLLNANIDSENEVMELYEDNNISITTFTITKDSTAPSLKVTFDGKEIFDGDYVSNSPEIKINLFDNSEAILDTNLLKMWLDDAYISYSRLNPVFGDKDPIITLTFHEKLSNGEHILKVLARDASGNFVSENGEVFRFLVMNECRLLSVNNYPNPCRYETFFTFRLTKIPDHLKINVYTCSGRLIKQITKYSPELKTDFNSIYWDVKDEEGDLLANGVYFYKVIVMDNIKSSSVIQKLAVVR